MLFSNCSVYFSGMLWASSYSKHITNLTHLAYSEPIATLAPRCKAKALRVFSGIIKKMYSSMRDGVCQDKKNIFVRIMFLKAASRNIQLMTDVNKLEYATNTLKRGIAGKLQHRAFFFPTAEFRNEPLSFRDDSESGPSGVDSDNPLTHWAFFFPNDKCKLLWPIRKLHIGSIQGHNGYREPPFEYWRGVLDGRRDGCLKATFTDVW